MNELERIEQLEIHMEKMAELLDRVARGLAQLTQILNDLVGHFPDKPKEGQ
jgi:hypothetical protein